MNRRKGATNYLYVLAIVSLIALVALFYWLMRTPQRGPGGSVDQLMVYCAAGMRVPVEQIADEYQREYGVAVQLQYGGSATLLSQLEISQSGDLYLAADDSYIDTAREKGLVAEELSVATIRPVIAVQKGNPKQIHAIGDLLREDVRVALPNPDQAASGRTTRKLLTESGDWEQLNSRVGSKGVFKPTVTEVANDVKLGSVDAGIVWDSTVAQYTDLEAVRAPQLDAGTAHVTLGVMNRAKDPTAALQFARYVSARDRGLKTFAANGFETVDGDVWAEVPEITLFAGAVNRKALEPIVKRFEEREGVKVNTVFNGCGILTAQMRTMQQNQQSGFPDVYMACDVYYLDAVRDMFQEAADVSNAAIVIVVAKGNPKGIKTLRDLTKPGVRVAIGQPKQCTIGVLSRRLLEKEGIYDELLENNVVTQTASSSMLVPNVTTGSADAVLAYVTDTLAERDKLEVIAIDSPLAKAVQPFSVSRSSDFKHLGRRLFDTLAQSREAFESAGFRWQLEDSCLCPMEQRPAAPADGASDRQPEQDKAGHSADESTDGEPE